MRLLERIGSARHLKEEFSYDLSTLRLKHSFSLS